MLDLLFPSFASQKANDVPIFGTFWEKNLILASKSAILRVCHVCEVTGVIRWMFVLILGCMERGDP